MSRGESFQFSRRDMLRLSILSGAASLVGSRAWAQACLDQTPTAGLPPDTLCGTGLEQMPYSPFILEPFVDSEANQLPVPKTLRPGWRRPDGDLALPNDPDLWRCRLSVLGSNSIVNPGPETSHQDAQGNRPNGKGFSGIPNAGNHQLWPEQAGTVVADYPHPIYYHIRLQVSAHRFTESKVQPIGLINKNVKNPVVGPVVGPNGEKTGALLPRSTIYGFNGTFPGSRINVAYGHPVCVRFENDLDLNPSPANSFGCLDRQDFGAPDWAFLTHLHNGHTAPESDGQPFHMTDNDGGYQPGEWVDNLYLMYPAGNDPREKQSFLWFHDHRMHHTGANVYKGMVGLMPHYDTMPEPGFPAGRDPGDETLGLRLPGVKTDYLDGSFDVDYDIPMAFYDCALDDGVTPHNDDHVPLDKCGQTHPEWWGKTFFRHYPNHGFVGDIFTVNGKAFPVLHVKPRRYRFRFLGASISRIYELSLMQGDIDQFPGQQGQWNFITGGKNVKKGAVRSRGTVRMNMRQIASEGGLLPFAIDRDFIQIWPAKRREVVVDFSQAPGETMYLANTMFMPDGRKPMFAGDKGFDPTYCVPLVKIIVDSSMGGETDNSLMPAVGQPLRPMPDFAADPATLTNWQFTLARGGLTSESQWVINDQQFDPLNPLHVVTQGVPETWTGINGGGGWVHPMHMHMEEHHVLNRVGSTNPHPDDTGREDVIALDPSESVTFYRNFRTFLGHYVAHCHNLAHEDHNMMFGWTIAP